MIENSSLSPFAIKVSLSLIAVSAIALFRRSKIEKGKGDSKQHGSRRISFTSASVAMGVYPEEIKSNDPIIHVLMYFESEKSSPTYDDVITLVTKAMEYERLAGIPVGDFGKDNWTFQTIEPPVDPNKMIRTIKINCDGNDASTKIIEQNIDISLRLKGRNDKVGPEEYLPWWEFLRIVNVGTGRSVLCLRIDHALGDGLSLGKLFQEFLTKKDGSPVNDLIPRSMTRQKAETQRITLMMILKSISTFLQVVRLPSSNYDHDIAFGNSKNKLQVYSGNRKCVFFDPIPLSFVKDLKDKLNVTLNDIVLTALSQAIHDYCLHCDCPVLKKMGEEVQCRGLVMVGLPNGTTDKSLMLRNRWSSVSFDLGIGHDDLSKRYKHVATESNKLKKSPIALITLFVQNKLGPCIPFHEGQRKSYGLYSRHTICCTNVPGPQETVLIAGKPIIEGRFTVNNILPVMTILSNNNQIFISLTIDDKDNKDVHLLPQFYFKALSLLAKEANIEVPSRILACIEE